MQLTKTLALAVLAPLVLLGCPAFMSDDFIIAPDGSVGGDDDGTSSSSGASSSGGSSSGTSSGASSSGASSSGASSSGTSSGGSSSGTSSGGGGDGGAGIGDASRAEGGTGDGSCASFCSGCCYGEICVDGGSSIACGKNGATCQNCTTLGGTCASAACSYPPVDGGCTLNCTCVPFYQVTCCKPDHTCGCRVAQGGVTCS
jgi:hypothetical protein